MIRILPLLLALAACGTDVSLSFRTSSGTIVDDPSCDGNEDFSLREEGGLVVLVVVDDDTDFRFASGFPASCEDLEDGLEARVRGRGDERRIRAEEIEILG